MPLIANLRPASIALNAQLFDATLAYGELSVSVVMVESTVERDGQALVGYGLSPLGWHAPTDTIERRMLARLRAVAPDELQTRAGTLDPLAVREFLLTHEPPGIDAGRALAAATIEMALWDLAAKIEERPLYRLLAERFNGGRGAQSVDVTAACGYYSLDPNQPPLASEITRLQELGYRAIEARIGGLELDDDLEPLAGAIQLAGGPGNVALNAACGLDEDLAVEYAEALAGRELRWLAELGDPHDFEFFEELSDAYPAPLATGSRLISLGEIRNLLRYSALRPERDLLLLDPAALGLSALLESLALLPEHGWQRHSVVAAGGQPLFALHVAAGLGLAGSVAAPLAFTPFGELGDGVTLVDGRATPPGTPGIGFEGHPVLLETLRQALGS